MAGVWVIKVCDDVEGVNDEIGIIVATIYHMGTKQCIYM